MSLYKLVFYNSFFFFIAECVAAMLYALQRLQCHIEDNCGKEEVLATMKEWFSAFIDLPKVCRILSSFLNNSVNDLQIVLWKNSIDKWM